jgi:hypothetical protein
LQNLINAGPYSIGFFFNLKHKKNIVVLKKNLRVAKNLKLDKSSLSLGLLKKLFFEFLNATCYQKYAITNNCLYKICLSKWFIWNNWYNTFCSGTFFFKTWQILNCYFIILPKKPQILKRASPQLPKKPQSFQKALTIFKICK